MIDVTEINFFRITARYIDFDHNSNKEILGELKMEQVDEKLRRFKSN